MNLRPTTQGSPLIFFPDLGGNVLYCRDLVARLPDGISPYALPLTNEAINQLNQVTIETLAEDFASTLVQSFPDQPLQLAGFSFAGILAYETARTLARKGHPATHIWLFDTRVHRLHLPSLFRQRPVKETLRLAKYAVGEFLNFGRNADHRLRSYRLLSIDLETRPKAYWPIIRALYAALAKYRPSTLSDTPVTLFQVNEPHGNSSRPSSLGWDRLTRRMLRVVAVEAEHLTIMHARSSLDRICEVMAGGTELPRAVSHA